MAITSKTYTYTNTTDPYLTSKLFQTLQKIASSYTAEIKLEPYGYTISAPGIYFRAIDNLLVDYN